MSAAPSRRQFLRLLALGSGAALAAACSQPAAPAAPTAASKPASEPAKPAAPTSAPAPAASPAAGAAPAASPAAAAPAAQSSSSPGGRLVFALDQWATETPFAWRTGAVEQRLWDVAHDPLIQRDPQTFAMKPGLATEWNHSADYKTWTFKLRQGVQFHENYGEMTADDVKFTIEQNLKPDSQGGSAPFFRAQLASVETPDKYTVVLNFKNPVWETLTHFAQRTGYQNITSRKYLESVGEEKAALHPIGTGPYHHVEGKQGDFHRFEAVQNHWRVTPYYREFVVRRIPDMATAVSALRAGEIDIIQVAGDFLAQAKQAGFRIQEAPDSIQYWIVLPGQTLPDKEDFCPKCPWVGDPNDSKSLENARKVRLAMNLAVNRKAIYDGLWQGFGGDKPFSPWYFPVNKGFSADWKMPPFDQARAKQLLAEAGVPNGFEIKLSSIGPVTDGADVTEAVALDLERIGIKVQRYKEDWGSMLPKNRQRKTNVTGIPYGSAGMSDDPALLWQRTIWGKGTFYFLAESPVYDQLLDPILREVDTDKRAALTRELGQKVYDDYRGIMVGVKSATWAVSKKVATWPTLVGTMWENNLDLIRG